MSAILQLITSLYIPIFSAITVGFVISFILSHHWFKTHFKASIKEIVPMKLGQFLFWIGVPISIINFLHQADLSGNVFIAPVIAWGAILLALGLSWLGFGPYFKRIKPSSQGSFLLSSMFGNTGYMGFPVTLLLPQLGAEYFGWALFYDLLGTLLGVYGFGVFLALHFGQTLEGKKSNPWFTLLQVIIKNPTVFAFILGLFLRRFTFPPLLAISLNGFAWSVVMLSLILMGMRLQQLSSWRNIKPIAMAVSVRMFLVPIIVGMGLTALGITGPPRLVMVLQSGMPCAFATIIISDNYGLNRELVVGAVALSSIMLLVTLPLWLLGFSTW